MVKIVKYKRPVMFLRCCDCDEFLSCSPKDIYDNHIEWDWDVVLVKGKCPNCGASVRNTFRAEVIATAKLTED